MNYSSSLYGALAAERERGLREKARDTSSRPRTRLPRRLRTTTATD
jgi:hypothetical protein